MEMNSSLYRMVSVGTVVADKNDNSPFLSVYMKELLPFHTGNVTDDVINIKRNGVDMDGNAYSVTLQRCLTVKARWKGDPNRITSPNLRNGQDVEVWEVGNSGKYYWSEMAGNDHLKRQESVTWGWNASGTPVTEGEPSTAENKYTATVDTKRGFAEFRTTMANGELAKYTLQLNGADGHVTLTDHHGNVFQLNSEESSISFTNVDQSTIAVYGKNIYMSCPETANLKCKNAVVECENNAIVKCGNEATVECKTSNVKYSDSANISASSGNSVSLSQATMVCTYPNIILNGNVLITGATMLGGGVSGGSMGSMGSMGAPPIGSSSTPTPQSGSGAPSAAPTADVPFNDTPFEMYYDGKTYKYSLRINGWEDHATITDRWGNTVKFDYASAGTSLINPEGSIVAVHGKNILASCEETADVQCKNAAIICETASIQYSDSANIIAANGNGIELTQTTMLCKFHDVTMEGTVTFTGDVIVDGDATINGTTSVKTINGDEANIPILHGTADKALLLG